MGAPKPKPLRQTLPGGYMQGLTERFHLGSATERGIPAAGGALAVVLFGGNAVDEKVLSVVNLTRRPAVRASKKNVSHAIGSTILFVRRKMTSKTPYIQ